MGRVDVGREGEQHGVFPPYPRKEGEQEVATAGSGTQQCAWLEVEDNKIFQTGLIFQKFTKKSLEL